MIVTLAGHVDHGKTSLVRALTGVDTDRLPQEQQRGLTIDLGFAYIDAGRVGFVDVPGHHKFIHNMVAGVASRQHALLVIAADDGPMPQSREHLDILEMAGLRSGVVALTKCDRAAPEQTARSEARVAELTRSSFLADAPVIPTSSVDGRGIDELLAHLRRAAAQQRAAPDDEPFRLAADRAFVVRGAGVVVTGTIHSGAVRVDQALRLFPGGTAVRVRALRAQDQPVAEARAGERCALNLSGLGIDQVQRGHWIVEAATRPTRNITVALNVLRDFPRAVKHWTPVHVYHATSHTTARLALMTDSALQPGEQQWADLVLDEPLACRRGDRVVIRDQSLDVTLGGGEVIHVQMRQPARRRAPERRAEIAAYAHAAPAQSLEALLARGPVDLRQFQYVWHLHDQGLQRLTGAWPLRQAQQLAVSEAIWDAWSAAALRLVSDHHDRHPTSTGLRENAFPVHPAFRQALLNELVTQGRLANSGGVYHLPDRQAALPRDLADLWTQLQPRLTQQQGPSVGDLAKAFGVAPAKLGAQLKRLARLGLLVQVSEHRFYRPEQLDALAAEAARLASPFTAAQFRDAAGMGRNVAIEVLEYFDGRGYTRRDGNVRRVVRAWA